MSIVAIYVAALVPALVMAMLQPVWSRVDEAQHADVLAQYQHGTWPVAGRTMLQPEIVAVTQATGVYRWYLAGAGPTPAETDPATFTPAPAGATKAAVNAWTARHLWGYSYEAMQPPLYYLLTAPSWQLGFDYAGTAGALLAARLFSALLAAMLAPLTYILVISLQPAAERTALLGAGIAALLPGFVLNATQVTNDGLAAVLGAALTVAAVQGARDGWSWRRGLAVGGLLGAAAMAKLTALGLFPLVVLALLWPGRQPYRQRARPIVLAALAFIAWVAPWALLNLHLFGQPVPMRANRELLGAVFGPPAMRLSYVLRSTKNALAAFWVGEPYGEMPLTRYLAYAAAAWCVAATVGVVLVFRRRRPRRDLAVLVLLGAAAQVAWALATPFTSGIGGFVPGRYMYPAAAAVLGLMAIGTMELPRIARRSLPVVAGGLSLLALALLASGHPGQSAQPRPLPAPAAGRPVMATAALGGLTLTADRVAVGESGRVAWVHVTLRNDSRLPADWSPTPAAATPAERLYGDYAGSTPFPERIDPGARLSGWIRMWRASDDTPLQDLTITFHDVTTDAYRSVANLTLEIPG